MRKILFVFDTSTDSSGFHNLLNSAQGSQVLPEGTRQVLDTAVEIAFPRDVSFLAKLVQAAEERGHAYEVFEIEGQSNQNT